MKIAFFTTDQAVRDCMTQQLPGHQLVFYEQALNADFQPDQTDFDVVSVTVHSKVSTEVLAKFPNLKLVATRSTGTDHIDETFAKEHNIAIASVPTYGEHTVAEFAFALMLGLTRKVPQAFNQLKAAGALDQSGLQGIDLFGKTLGVVGTGKIGMHVVQIALGFGMKVVAYDLYPKADLATSMGFTYVSLEQLLSESDIITLHCPSTPETEHLLNAQNLPTVKKGALIINDARGAVIDTQALVDNLKLGQVGGAALDVLEHEDQLTEVEKELLNLPNVLVTPHIAFDTVEAVNRINQTTVENILKVTNV